MRKRLLQLIVLCLATFTMLGAGDPGKRFDRLGHGLVCQCGCGQILLECNHVGCPVSPKMIAELQTQIATGLPDSGVLGFFITKYGPVSLAAPIRGGFDNVAWIVPYAALLLAFGAVFLVVRLWKRRQAELPVAASPEPVDSELRARIRRDTDWQ
jgi:cytochrome c-type biogenesis protein CcmH